MGYVTGDYPQWPVHRAPWFLVRFIWRESKVKVVEVPIGPCRLFGRNKGLVHTVRVNAVAQVAQVAHEVVNCDNCEGLDTHGCWREILRMTHSYHQMRRGIGSMTTGEVPRETVRSKRLDQMRNH